MLSARTASSSIDSLDRLEEGLPLLPGEAAKVSLDDVIDGLDEGLPLVPSREPSKRMPFAEPSMPDTPDVPDVPEPAEDAAVPVGFILLMLLVGASTAALVFHNRLSQILVALG